jgi:hypothetical protein
MTVAQLVSGNYCPITGEPLKIDRNDSTGRMKTKGRKSRKAYNKKWYEANKTKKQEYYQANRDSILKYYKEKNAASK